MSQLDTVGQRINFIRNELGLTLEALADRSGLSKSFIWEVEQDRSGISGRRLLQVADALNASVEYLLRGGTAPKEYEPPSIEVPRSLGELAEEVSLTYRQDDDASRNRPVDCRPTRRWPADWERKGRVAHPLSCCKALPGGVEDEQGPKRHLRPRAQTCR